METITKIGTKTGLLNIIGELENVCKRPAMWINKKDDVDGVINFLQGFLTACDALGFGYSRDISRQVHVESDWESGAEGVWLQMRQKGMSEEAIVQELLRMEIRTRQKQVALLLASEE
ncbi:MAG: hypothetical protein ACRYFS_09780 [Janthinobacterium lividum]